MQFEKLNLIEPLLRALHHEGYTEPTPIQEQAIPHLLAGRDLIGCAQTGTGKTAAFALPLLQRMHSERPASQRGARPIRTLVLSPTRELASQIGESFAAYGRHLALRHAVIFGGVGQDPQERALRAGVDILVATPGRLLDLMQQGHVRFASVEYFVLDEADRMLDMGFIHDVRRIIAALPAKRQTLLFSATMPQEIQELADKLLKNPVRVEVTPIASTVDKIEQSIYFVERSGKRALLEHLLKDPKLSRTLVFSRTKHGANKVAEQLDRAGISAEAIHGNKSQSARERALLNFKRGTTRVLVATDIAARGIDIDEISHVINYDLPNIPESYVHRIGRTARAGASGIAISFCDGEEREYLRDIERLIRIKIPVVAEHPWASSGPIRPVNETQSSQQSRNRPQPGGLPSSRRSEPSRGRGGRGQGQPSSRSSEPRDARHNRAPSRGGDAGQGHQGQSQGSGDAQRKDKFDWMRSVVGTPAAPPPSSPNARSFRPRRSSPR